MGVNHPGSTERNEELLMWNWTQLYAQWKRKEFSAIGAGVFLGWWQDHPYLGIDTRNRGSEFSVFLILIGGINPWWKPYMWL